MRVIVIGGGAAGFFAAITCANLSPETEECRLGGGKRNPTFAINSPNPPMIGGL